jgi:RNA polymerase sigma-70 factor (ECF subfamily)
VLDAMVFPLFPHAVTGTSPTDAGDLPSVEARAARGDRGALEALLRAHARAVADLAQALCGPVEGRDAAQEALEKIVMSIGRFDPSRGAFRAWALTVARNVCRDRLRRRGLERAAFAADGEEPVAYAAGDLPDPERIAVARAGSVRVAAALETLPPPMRSALVLFHVHEASYEEIAETLDVPIGTVMTWLHRGRKRLRDALPEEAAR